MVENNENQVEWNLSSSLIQEIADLLSEANNHIIKGSYVRSFQYLQGIKRRIVQNLSPAERKQFVTLDSSFLAYYKAGFQSKKYPQKLNKPISYYANKAMVLLEDYNTLLMDCLERYGYLIQKKQDSKKVF